MNITKVESHRIRIPSKGDYRMAKGAHVGLHSLVVVLHTDGGVTGVGESHQGVSSYSAETIDTMKAVVDNVYGPLLIGRELEAVEQLAVEMGEARCGNLFARCAVETALFDALARMRNQNIASLLGGPVRRRLLLSGSIGIDEPETMAKKAAELALAGYRTVKVKIGTADVMKDLVRVREVRKAVGDEVSIRLDANAGYSPTDALTLVRALGGLGIEHVEQPVAGDHLDAMVKLTRLGCVPILADESVHTPEHAYRVISMGAVDAIKIKISKVGGYIAARKIIDICEASGTKVVIGQGICSSLEAAAEAQMACAYPHVYPVGEMVGPTKLHDDLSDPALDLSQGFLDLPKGLGIGVNLSREHLKKYSLDAG